MLCVYDVLFISRKLFINGEEAKNKSITSHSQKEKKTSEKQFEKGMSEVHFSHE